MTAIQKQCGGMERRSDGGMKGWIKGVRDEGTRWMERKEGR